MVRPGLLIISRENVHHSILRSRGHPGDLIGDPLTALTLALARTSVAGSDKVSHLLSVGFVLVRLSLARIPTFTVSTKEGESKAGRCTDRISAEPSRPSTARPRVSPRWR